jgi:uncharacterized membrane protein
LSVRLPALPWVVLNCAAAQVALTLVLFGPESPLRPFLILPFVLLLPGTALVRLLRLGDPLLELTLGITLSVALATLAATTALYAGVWSADAILVALAAAAVAAGLWELRRERRSPLARETS